MYEITYVFEGDISLTIRHPSASLAARLAQAPGMVSEIIRTLADPAGNQETVFRDLKKIS